mgnify:CR=1 FL=1
MIYNLEQAGFGEQEIYGMIINLAVNGNVLEEKEYGYTNLLGNVNNACKTIIKYKNKINKNLNHCKYCEFNKLCNSEAINYEILEEDIYGS